MPIRCGMLGAVLTLTVVAIGCCPVPPGGPSATGVVISGRFEPGDIRYVDAEVPAATTQLNFQMTLDRVGFSVRVRQIPPDCMPAVDDACANAFDHTFTPTVAGFSANGVVAKPKTRVVLQNVSNTPLTMTLTITPWRAGCT